MSRAQRVRLGMKTGEKPSQLRVRIAQEAARLLVHSGRRDYQSLKHKAARKLGARHRSDLPSNREIEEAVEEHLQLFEGADQTARVERLRHRARELLELLAPFNPCLVGAVLRGTADEHTPITLHAFVEPPEEVGLHLGAHRIRYALGEQRVRLGHDRYRARPSYRFAAGGTPVEVVVFPVDGRRQAPLSPVDGRPMQRADLAQLDRLLHDEA